MNNFDPFNRYKQGFSMLNKSPTDFARPAIGASQQIQERREKEEAQTNGISVFDLPEHLYTPSYARSLDLRRAVIAPPGTNAVIMQFQGLEGTTTFFTHYAIFNDALDASLVEFRPVVNGKRAFPFHGDPANNYRISLGLAPDISNNSLIEAQLKINPGDTLQWYVINNSAVDVVMAVRLKGYIANAQRRSTATFGG